MYYKLTISPGFSCLFISFSLLSEIKQPFPKIIIVCTYNFTILHTIASFQKITGRGKESHAPRVRSCKKPVLCAADPIRP